MSKVIVISHVSRLSHGQVPKMSGTGRFRGILTTAQLLWISAHLSTSPTLNLNQSITGASLKRACTIAVCLDVGPVASSIAYTQQWAWVCGSTCF